MKYLISFFFLVFCNYQIYAQCCAAGSPSNTNGISADGDKNILTISLSNRYSYSDQYFIGSIKQDKSTNYFKNAFYDFSNFSLSYGISKKLSVSTEIGYFLNKSFVMKSTDYLKYSTGLADAMFSASYKIYSSEKHKFSLVPMAKITIPVGAFDVVYNHVLLPIDAQPSSGNFRYSGGLILSKGFKNEKFSMLSVNTFEYSQKIDTEKAHYKYGNQLIVSLIGNYKQNDNLLYKFAVRSIMRGHSYDYKQADPYVKASGGVYLYAVPEINYTFYKTWKLGLVAELPFYRNMNEYQLANNYAFEVRLTKRIDFNKNTEVDLSKVVFKTSFTVFGLCEMCKERIEKTALQYPGVIQAIWNAEANVLYIGATKVIDVEDLKKDLAKVGHDSDTQKADDKVYEKLPACCHYR